MGIDIVCDNTTHLCLIITGKATTATPPDVCMKVLHLRSRHYSALISYTLATVVLITPNMQQPGQEGGNELFIIRPTERGRCFTNQWAGT